MNYLDASIWGIKFQKKKIQIPKKIKYDASIEDFRIANVLDNLDMNYLDASIRGIKFQKKNSKFQKKIKYNANIW